MSDAMPERGRIYVLFNPSMPGLVKIGMTTRSSEERASELSGATGVPEPYVVVYDEEVCDCPEAERRIHARLASFRKNNDREFFRLDLKDAVRAVVELGIEFRDLERAITPDARETGHDDSADEGRHLIDDVPRWRHLIDDVPTLNVMALIKPRVRGEKVADFTLEPLRVPKPEKPRPRPFISMDAKTNERCRFCGAEIPDSRTNAYFSRCPQCNRPNDRRV